MSITSRQIMDALGIESMRTLNRWEKAGVIPAKRMALHPNGIGRVAYWEDWVLAHSRRVQQLVHDGFTLKRVAEQFGDDWGAISKRYGKYNFADISIKQDQQRPIHQIVDDVTHEVSRLILALSGGRKGPPPAIVTYDNVLEAVELAHHSIDPVLLIDDGKAYVTADFAVSGFLAKRNSSTAPIAIISLWPHIRARMPSPSVPNRPRCKPCKKFIDKEGNEVSYRLEKHYRINFDE